MKAVFMLVNIANDEARLANMAADCALIAKWDIRPGLNSGANAVLISLSFDSGGDIFVLLAAST